MITNKTLTRVIDNDLIINSNLQLVFKITNIGFNKHNHDLDPNIVNKAAESMKLEEDLDTDTTTLFMTFHTIFYFLDIFPTSSN